MEISKRGRDIQESPIRKLKPYADQAVAEGVSIYHLNIGQPDISTPQPVWDSFKECSQGVLSYGPAQGFLELRQAIAAYFSRYNISLNADDILITVGGSEAIHFVFSVVSDPGGEVIIPEPFYTNYNGFAAGADVKISPMTLDAADGFRLPSAEVIAARINKNTRAIMLCSPNNPTGTVYTPDELDRIVSLVQKHDLYLIADEVYKEFVYDGEVHKSILEYTEISDRTIVVDSISKRFSCCGARIGSVITRNAEVYQSVLKFAQARLCPPSMEQKAALAAYQMDPDYFTSVRIEYQKRRDILYAGLQDIPGVGVNLPQGAFYNIVTLPLADSEHFVRWMLTDFRYQNSTVMLAPAQGFYSTAGLGKNQVRIAYVLKEEDLKKAIYILKAGLEQYQQEFVKDL